MPLWLVLAALTALVLALLALPLLRRGGAAAERADFDIEVYLDQLRELERDAARGAIGAAEAEAARLEIERRLLAADRQRDAGAAAPARDRRHPVLAIILIVALPIAAAAAYLQLGSPSLPDLPFAERPPAPDGDLVARAAARVAEAEAAVRDNPDDPRAWFDLGRIRAMARRWPGAAEAFGEAARRDPGEPVYIAAWAEALIFAADGTVTPRARELLAAALAGAPGDPRSRYYTALGEQQAGESEPALGRFAALLADSPADAPWRGRVETRIRELAGQLDRDADAILAANEPRGAPQAGPAPRGPNAGDVAAAQQMAPEERQAMIRSMVEGLAARLDSDPGDVEGWRQLGKSWGVLGEPAKASVAYGRALEIAPDDPQTLFNGAIAAMEAGDRDTALDRFTRLKAQIPPEHTAYGAVERAIERLEGTEKP